MLLLGWCTLREKVIDRIVFGLIVCLELLGVEVWLLWLRLLLLGCRASVEGEEVICLWLGY